MATLYSVRMRVRASLARAATTAALFCLIAVALLAGAAAAAPADDKPGQAPDLAAETPGGQVPAEPELKPEQPKPEPLPAEPEPQPEQPEPATQQPAPDTGATDDDDEDEDEDGVGGTDKPGDEDKPDKPDKPEKPDDGDGDGDDGQAPDQGGSANTPPIDEPEKEPAPVQPTATPVPTASPAPRTQPRSRNRRAGQRRGRGRALGGVDRRGANPGGGGSVSSPSADAGGVAGSSGSGGSGSPGASAAAEQARAVAAAQAAAERRRERLAAERRREREAADEGSPVTRTVTRTVSDIVEVVPDSMKAALAALAALAVLLGGGYFFSTVRARRLARQRRELLSEVGLLQGALLPTVPAAVGGLRTSVAYRPAEGPGAGGDFYDVVPLSGGRVGFILGDVSGHGRSALERTAFMRYTLRAYLEAGLEPRVALQVADRVIDENLGGDFATVILAVHDPESGALTYASAGHPAPIITGPEEHEPVTAASSPPIGVGVRTGLRQTTVPLEPGSVACFYTDGLSEARTEDGILGRWRLAKLVSGLGRDADAEGLLDSVARESRKLSDDMATVLIAPTSGVTAGGFRSEQLEVSAKELDGPLVRRFLDACGVDEADAEAAERQAGAVAGQFGGAVLHVVLGNRTRVEVLPRNVESIEAASRRAAAR